MRSQSCAGVAIALACLSGCGRPPAPPAPPSGAGWRIVAEGAQEVSRRTVKTGRDRSVTVLSASRPNDGPTEASATEEDIARQLAVGRNVSALSAHPATASERATAASDRVTVTSEKP